MKKEKIKNILLIVIVALVTSFVTAYGVSSTFDSSNVCYKVDSSTGASVQDTIDDLYGRASDYSSVNNKINGYFQNSPTSYFDGNILELGKTNTTSNTALNFYNDSILTGALYTRKSDHALIITTDNNKPLLLFGRPINLLSEQVQINGKSINDLIVTERTPYTVTIDTSATQVYFSATKSGYTAIAYNLIHNHATTTIGGIEAMTLGNGSVSGFGFFKDTAASKTVNFYFDVTWIKNL